MQTETTTTPDAAGAKQPADNRLPFNIEKSCHRRGEYIGFCGGAQRIRREGNVWNTYALGSAAGTFHYSAAFTLADLGRQLEAISALLGSRFTGRELAS